MLTNVRGRQRCIIGRQSISISILCGVFLAEVAAETTKFWVDPITPAQAQKTSAKPKIFAALILFIAWRYYKCAYLVQ